MSQSFSNFFPKHICKKLSLLQDKKLIEMYIDLFFSPSQIYFLSLLCFDFSNANRKLENDMLSKSQLIAQAPFLEQY